MGIFSQPDPPTREPDDLRSKDKMEVILGVSEGPIYGLEDGAKSFYLGDTPLKSATGEDNFTAFRMDIHSGDELAQPVLTELGGTANSTTVNVNLAHNTPVVRQTSLGSINYLEVRLVFNALYYNNDDGTFRTEAFFRIEYKAASSSTWNKFFDEDLTIFGKTTSSYVREFRQQVDPINEPYDIRVTKLSPESDNNYVADLNWESFQEVITTPTAYPNTAIAHLVAESTDQFSSVPQFSGIYKGRVIKVPSNYDPTARTYTGIWDGTFSLAWTDNPAWCLYDFIENDRYGINAYYSVTADKYDFYEAAQWCDELVPDGFGGTQPRYTFNDVISQARSGKDMLKYMAGVFNAVPFDDLNGSIHLRIDKPEDPVMIFSPENVVEGEFEYSYADLGSRYNDITVSFINPDLNWTEDRRRVFDQDSINELGHIPIDLVAVGCTNASEAIRRAKYKLITSQTEVETISFRTTRLGRFLQPFDIILVADPDMDRAVSGRMKSISGDRTTVYLRDPVFLESGVAYTLQVKCPSEMLEVEMVPAESGSVTEFQLAAALPADVHDRSVWSLGRADDPSHGLPKAYRVLNVSEAGGTTDVFDIVALEVNRDKWTEVDNLSAEEVETYASNGPLNPQGGSVIDPPSNVTILQQVVSDASGSRIDLVISWDASQDPFLRGYTCSYSHNDSEPQLIGTTTQTSITLRGIEHGTYDIEVKAYNVLDEFSTPATGSITVGETSPIDTAKVTGLEIEGQGPDVEFKTRDVKFVWRANATTGSYEFGSEAYGGDTGFQDSIFKDYIVQVFNADTGDLIFTDYTTQTFYTFTYEQNLQTTGGPHRTFKFQVQIRDTYNRLSTPTSLVVTNPPPAVPPGLTVYPMVGAVGIDTTFPDNLSDYAGMIVWSQPADDTPIEEATVEYIGADTSCSFENASRTSIWVRAAWFDVFGQVDLNLSTPQEVTPAFSIDTEPPAVPTGLSLTTGLTSSGNPFVKAEWNENSESDLDHYNVQIKEGTDEYLTYVVDGTDYTWTVVPQTQYTIRVQAVDGSTNKSAYTTAQQITSTVDNIPPADITGLSASASFNNVWLKWNVPSDNDYSHAIVYAAEISSFASSSVISTHATGDSFNHTGLASGDTQYYWVRPVDTSGNEGNLTGPVSATTASLQLEDFPSDLSPIRIVDSLDPAGPTGSEIYVRLSTDGVLYVWDGSNWVDAVADAAVAPGSITADKIAANAVVADKISAGAVQTAALAAGAITADKLSTGELITLSAQIKDAIIDDAKIANLSAAKLTAGSALASTITVSGQALGTIQSNANDPAARINAHTTTIDPGKITIYGSTTLANWRNGPNSTEINGGSVAANSISANKLTIGSRGITVDGIEFQPQLSGSNVTWSSGSISYINDAGSKVTVNISAGSTTGKYIYWVKDASYLSSTTLAATAVGDDRITLATNFGNGKIAATYGATQIHGDSIVTGSLDVAGNITAGSITVDKLEANALSANNFLAGTINTGAIYLNSSRFEILSGSQPRIVVKDTNGVNRAWLGQWGTGINDYGFRCFDSAGQLVIGADGLGLEIADTAHIKTNALTETEYVVEYPNFQILNQNWYEFGSTWIDIAGDRRVYGSITVENDGDLNNLFEARLQVNTGTVLMTKQFTGQSVTFDFVWTGTSGTQQNFNVDLRLIGGITGFKITRSITNLISYKR